MRVCDTNEDVRSVHPPKSDRSRARYDNLMTQHLYIVASAASNGAWVSHNASSFSSSLNPGVVNGFALLPPSPKSLSTSSACLMSGSILTYRLPSLWEIGCPFELSALRHRSSFGSVFAYRNTFSMLTPSSNPILRNQGFLCLLLILEWWGHPAIWLLRFSWSTATRVWDSSPSSKPLFGSSQSSWKFSIVGEFSQMHLRGRMTRNCHATWSTSPNTNGMASHGLKRISVVQTFSSAYPEKQGKTIVLHSHFSQFLLFSESPMMLPSVLSHCVIHQALVGQVDNQKRFREYSYPLVKIAAFQLRSKAFLNSR